MHFEDLNHLYSTMDEAKIVDRAASMSCLVAFVEEDNFAEAMQFVDFINTLPGNPIKNRKKHLIIMTQTRDHILLQNKTVSFNVHIISSGEPGK